MAIHAALVAGLILLFNPFEPEQVVTYIDLAAPEEMVYYGGARGGSPEAPLRQSASAPAARAQSVAPPVETPAPSPVRPATPAVAESAPVVIGEEDSLPTDTHRQLVPGYGDGRLWVRAGDAARGNVPARVAADSVPIRIASVDSLLAQKIRIFMDTVPPDSFATRSAPKWTTQIAGKTWGIDGKWIYLGGLKIPTTVLALIPLPVNAGGNYDAGQRALLLESRRRDIVEAAQRATTALEFKKFVKETRERKQQERDLQNAQSETPTPVDTVPAEPVPPLYP